MTLVEQAPGGEASSTTESNEQPVASLDISRLHQLRLPPQEENSAAICRYIVSSVLHIGATSLCPVTRHSRSHKRWTMCRIDVARSLKHENIFSECILPNQRDMLIYPGREMLR